MFRRPPKKTEKLSALKISFLSFSADFGGARQVLRSKSDSSELFALDGQFFRSVRRLEPIFQNCSAERNFGQKYFRPKEFSTKNFFDRQNVRPPPKKRTKQLPSKNFFGRCFFGPKNCSKKFSTKKCFDGKNSRRKMFSSKKNSSRNFQSVCPSHRQRPESRKYSEKHYHAGVMSIPITETNCISLEFRNVSPMNREGQHFFFPPCMILLCSS